MGGLDMAVVVATRVLTVSKEEVDQLGQSLEMAMTQRGGPPAGHMVHIVYPSGQGLVIQDVWRTEADMRAFYDTVLLPALSELGLQAEESVVEHVWSFARP